MYKVNHISLITGATGSAQFETEQLAQDYVDMIISTEVLGKNARWLPDFLAEVETREVEIQPAQVEYTYEQEGETIIVPAVDAVMQTEYLHPAEYSYEIVDITAEYEAEQNRLNMIADGELNYNCCSRVKKLIGGYNRNRHLTLEQIQSMLGTFATINECLGNDMPETALGLISQVVADGTIITQQMIDDAIIIFGQYGFMNE